MLPLIEQSEFRVEFEHKEPQKKLVETIPTYFVNRELAAVEGLANYVRTPDRYDLTHASAHFSSK
jgi:glucokinase